MEESFFKVVVRKEPVCDINISKKQKEYRINASDHSKFSKALFFEEEQKIIACTSSSQIIRIFDSRTLDLIDTIPKSEHSGWIYDMIKWDSSSFMTCSGGDKSVRVFSTKSPNYQRLKIYDTRSYNFKLLKLDAEHFLVRSGEQALHVYHYEKGLQRKYFIGYLEECKMIMSRIYPNCFYINTRDRKQNIKLIDFKKDLIVSQYPPIKSKLCITFSIFFESNLRNDESLMVVEALDNIFIFRTSSQIYTVNIPVDLTSDVMNSSRFYYTSTYCKPEIFYDQFVAIGERKGFHLYEIQKKGKNEYFLEKLHYELGKQTEGFCLVEKQTEGFCLVENEKSKRKMEFVAAQFHSTISLFSVTGINLGDSQGEIDEKERRQFLQESIDDFIFTEDDKKRLTISIKSFQNFLEMENIFKVFLLQ